MALLEPSKANNLLNIPSDKLDELQSISAVDSVIKMQTDIFGKMISILTIKAKNLGHAIESYEPVIYSLEGSDMFVIDFMSKEEKAFTMDIRIKLEGFSIKYGFSIKSHIDITDKQLDELTETIRNSF